jgi:putative ABC transport system permease protein
MLILKIAFRNIFRHSRRSFLTGLIIGGGFVLFSVMIGIQYGSYSYLIDAFTRDRTGHVQIHLNGYLDKPSVYNAFGGYEGIGKQMEGIPYLESWAPRIYSPALAFKGKKTTGVRINGIDTRREKNTTRLMKKITTGRFVVEGPSQEIVVGEGLAEVLKAGVGDDIALITQAADGSIANGMFRIVGLTGPRDRTNAYLDIKTVQEFLVLGERVHEIAVILAGQDRARSGAADISALLNDPSFDVEPWQVVEEQFYRAMKADEEGGFITYLILMIIVSIGVLITVLMTILERTKEFGVLRAVGTRPAALFFMILLETTILAMLSIIPGIIISIGANTWLSIHGISITPIQFGGILFDRIVGEVTVKSILSPVLVTVGSAVLVSILPAIRAARISPAKAMQG